jgi:hypothetical protein
MLLGAKHKFQLRIREILCTFRVPIKVAYSIEAQPICYEITVKVFFTKNTKQFKKLQFLVSWITVRQSYTQRAKNKQLIMYSVIRGCYNMAVGLQVCQLYHTIQMRGSDTYCCRNLPDGIKNTFTGTNSRHCRHGVIVSASYKHVRPLFAKYLPEQKIFRTDVYWEKKNLCPIHFSHKSCSFRHINSPHSGRTNQNIILRIYFLTCEVMSYFVMSYVLMSHNRLFIAVRFIQNVLAKK